MEKCDVTSNHDITSHSTTPGQGLVMSLHFLHDWKVSLAWDLNIMLLFFFPLLLWEFKNENLWLTINYIKNQFS